MPLPAYITACRHMQDAAVARAARRFAEHGEPAAAGAYVQVLGEGYLVCTAERTKNGLYQPHWTLAGKPVSRLEAEAAMERHLADLRVNVRVNNPSPEMETSAGEAR